MNSPAQPAQSAANQLDPFRDMVASDKSAYFILPAQFVCGPELEQMLWSVDGEHLAVIRKYVDIAPSTIKDMVFQTEEEKALPDPECQIVVWSTVSRKATTLYSIKQTHGTINEMYWMTGSSQLIVLGTFVSPDDPSQTHMSILRLTTNGAVTPLTQVDPSMNYELEANPYKSQVAFVQFPVGPRAAPASTGNQPAPDRVQELPGVVRFLGTTGGFGQPINLPEVNCNLFWSSNGQTYALGFARDAKNRRLTRIWHVLNRATGKFEPSAAPPDAFDPSKEDTGPELTVEDLRPKVAIRKFGVNAPTVIVTATEGKEPEPAIISTDGAQGQLSPKFNAVSYATQGSVMVRAMVKIPLDAYRQARLAAMRTKIINQAKQVALGLLMYSGDYDDNALSNQGNWQSQLEPYLKDSSLTDGFNYTFGGGNMSSIANPASTVLGYLEGPGGRAVAFADGHVQWQPNP